VARTPRKLVIELPPDLPLLNANDRIHYRERSKRVEKLRSEAYKAAKFSGVMTFSRVKVRCIFRAPDNRRRDSANIYPSFKACLDGIVDAGVLKDDNDKYVTEFTIMRGENLSKRSQLILEIIEVDDG
jgi:crossover junction endodeoxyribonuclease RusA